MSDNYIELTEDEFDARYPLKPNHLNPSAGWATRRRAGVPLRDPRRRVRLREAARPAHGLDAY